MTVIRAARPDERRTPSRSARGSASDARTPDVGVACSRPVRCAAAAVGTVWAARAVCGLRLGRRTRTCIRATGCWLLLYALRARRARCDV